jgi:putative transcriptional regulator
MPNISVFTAQLDTSVSTMQKWEIDQEWPTGTALELLHS